MVNNVKYPENLKYKEALTRSGFSVKGLARQLNISRVLLSNIVNGHYKGTNITPKIDNILNAVNGELKN